jgi:hypothetical protein
MIKPAAHGIRIHGHIGSQPVEQWAFATQTCDLDCKPTAVQSVGDINELPFRASDIEMIEELENPNHASLSATALPVLVHLRSRKRVTNCS